MFLSVRRCAEHMTQLLRVKVTGQGHVIYPSIRVCSISPEPFEHFSLNFIRIFLSVRWCAEPMTQLRRLKVKVTLQGHGIYPWISCPSNLLNHLLEFIKHHSNVPLVSWCAEPMTQLCKLKVKVTLQGHGILLRGIWLSFRLLSCSVWYASQNDWLAMSYTLTVTFHVF